MMALEDLVGDFWRRTALLSGGPPDRVWHYTSSGGAIGVLQSGRLWLTSSSSQKDAQEIHWGNGLVTQVARTLRDERGSHPALDMLLDDPNATMFLTQREMFLACFTEDADSAKQWERADCATGAALVFGAKGLSYVSRTSEGGGSGLTAVIYDDDRILGLSEVYFRKVLNLAEFGGLRADDPAEYWKTVAQYLMEPGGLAFYSKRRGYAWEREWRIIRRAFISEHEILPGPRRVELDLRANAPPLVEVVLGERVSESDEAKIRDLAAQWQVPVSRSTIRSEAV